MGDDVSFFAVRDNFASISLFFLPYHNPALSGWLHYTNKQVHFEMIKIVRYKSVVNFVWKRKFMSKFTKLLVYLLMIWKIV
jgi:hypothetical protein